jgi:hypothetical protein
VGALIACAHCIVRFRSSLKEDCADVASLALSTGAAIAAWLGPVALGSTPDALAELILTLRSTCARALSVTAFQDSKDSSQRILRGAAIVSGTRGGAAHCVFAAQALGFIEAGSRSVPGMDVRASHMRAQVAASLMSLVWLSEWEAPTMATSPSSPDGSGKVRRRGQATQGDERLGLLREEERVFVGALCSAAQEQQERLVRTMGTQGVDLTQLRHDPRDARRLALATAMANSDSLERFVDGQMQRVCGCCSYGRGRDILSRWAFDRVAYRLPQWITMSTACVLSVVSIVVAAVIDYRSLWVRTVLHDLAEALGGSSVVDTALLVFWVVLVVVSAAATSTMLIGPHVARCFVSPREHLHVVKQLLTPAGVGGPSPALAIPLSKDEGKTATVLSGERSEPMYIPPTSWSESKPPEATPVNERVTAASADAPDEAGGSEAAPPHVSRVTAANADAPDEAGGSEAAPPHAGPLDAVLPIEVLPSLVHLQKLLHDAGELDEAAKMQERIDWVRERAATVHAE